MFIRKDVLTKLKGFTRILHKVSKTNKYIDTIGFITEDMVKHYSVNGKVTLIFFDKFFLSRVCAIYKKEFFY